ncbi:hypothetical protein AWJ20_3035 [Sugiyamaella lignohabitans]|uniref:EngB-type G domain-containing protein n=1 Tax=Sugiyamaella lignohabitans TaxID=796027 RepID=A0A167FK98_9ASCO|nr:uncharacterized protein AWJ20_3035 [Sugiyamaella lignohabitans]ANB15408.1 hypothetical protein AWJ20_3035 [Sugiyamaella lignohabitans]
MQTDMKKDNLRRLAIPFKLQPVQRSVASGLTNADIQKAFQFFNRCETKLADVVSNVEQLREEGGATRSSPNLPEVMMLGRSNVGKSSLITALMSPLNNDYVGSNNKIKEFARSSSKSGFTQYLHYYNCGRKLKIIDTPGYGHASKEAHGNLVLRYLQMQKNLRRVYVLVDGYVGISPLDHEMFRILGANGIPWNIVLTKLDKHITKPGITKSSKSGTKQFLTEQDADVINGVVVNALQYVKTMSSTPDAEGGNGTVLEEVFGTCSHRRLNYMGIPELRASVLSTCGLL